MTHASESHADAAWTAIARDQRLDRFIRRVCIAAWSTTLVLVLAYAVLVGFQVAQMFRLAGVGAVTNLGAAAIATPLIIVLGVLALLIATLSTVGVFLRQRAASLSEIQLRLSALEDMLAARGDAT